MSQPEQLLELAGRWGLPVIVDPVMQHEVAEMMGYTYSTFRTHRSLGKIPDLPEPSVVLGHVQVWHRHVIEQWLADRAPRVVVLADASIVLEGKYDPDAGE